MYNQRIGCRKGIWHIIEIHQNTPLILHKAAATLQNKSVRLVNPVINFIELDLPDKVNSVLFPEISDEDTKVGSENISRF